MADKDHDLDDFDLNDELDIPDFDDSGLDGPSMNDRKPVERVAGGFLEGVKSTSMDRNFQRRLIHTSLPDGYGKAFDDLDEAKRLGQDLYDTAASTLRPYEKTIKKIGRRVTEKADRFLPESLSSKLKAMTEPDNDRAQEVDYREAEITANLAGIFDAQMRANAEEKADDVTRENVRDVVDEQRYNTEIDVLKTMRSGLDRMVAYQDRVTASYQRKSLELQFRQLFVARDQYTLLEAHVKENKLQLQAISKNTALPEFVKLRGSEAMKQMLRERAYAGAIGAVTDRSRDFVGKIRDKALTRVKDFTRSVGEGLQGIGDAMDMTQDAGVQIDPLEMGGQMGAGMLMEEGVSRYGRRFGQLLSRIPGVDRMGDRLEYFSDNKEDAVRSFLNRLAEKGDDGLGSDFDYLSFEEQEARQRELDERTTVEKLRDVVDRGTGGIQASLARMALDFIGPEGSADRRFSQASANLATEVAPYTSLTDRSITEIIPGLLTNILHETEMIRTGRDDIERRVYDADARTFRREGDVQRDLMNTVMPSDRREAVREDIDRVIDEIDRDKTLSESARAGFRRQMLSDMAGGRGFRVERYANESDLSTVDDPAVASEIAELMRTTFLSETGEFRGGDDRAQSLRNRASRKYRTAMDTIPNYQEAVAQIFSVYGPEMLRDMGVLVGDQPGDNSLNTKGILDNFALDTGLDSQGLQAMPEFRMRSDALAEPRPAESPRQVVERTELDTSRMEESLTAMQSMLGQFVDVRLGETLQEGFKNVLSAIGQLDIREHFEINNDWLKKIYELLLDCCGPGGGGPTPPAGGQPPESGGPGPMSGPWARRVGDLNKLRRSAWERGVGLYGDLDVQGNLKALIGKAETKFSPVMEDPRTQSVLQRGRRAYEDASTYLGEMREQAPVVFERVKSAAERRVDQAKTLTAEDVRNSVVSGVDRLRHVDTDALYAQSRTLLSDAGQQAGHYIDQAREYGRDVAGRVMADPRAQQAKDYVTDQYGRVRERLPEDLTFGLKERFEGLGVPVDEAKAWLQSLGKEDFQTVMADLQSRVSSGAERARDLSLADVKQGALSFKDRLLGLSKDDLASFLPEIAQLDDYRLFDQSKIRLAQGRERLGSVVGEGLGRAQASIGSRFAGTEFGDRFEGAYGSMAEGLGRIKDRLGDRDFDLTQYLDEEAANDPRLMLTALQKASEDALARLQEVEVGSQVKTLTENVMGSTRGILSALKDKVGSVSLPKRDNTVPAEAPSGGGPSQPGDFWSNAWEMLTNLKGHMDEKTAQIIEAMGNLSLGGGEGQPGMFKRLAGKTMDGLGGIASYYGKAFKAGGNLLQGVGTGGKSILSGLGGRLGSMIRGKDKGPSESPIVDIYLEGQETPVMLARDLRRGMYFDRETLDEVYRIEDIQGAVIDNEENVVVTDEDVAEGRLYTLGGDEVKPGIMSRLAKGYMSYTTAPMRMLTDVVKRAGRFLKEKANEPQDIYVKGETSPRLLAIVMKNGGYLSKATQEPIAGPKDIDGDVVDLQGRTVLTEAELRDPGIVDARGRAIRAVAGGVSSAAGKLGDMLGSYYSGVWNAGKSLVRGVGNVLGFGDGEGGGGLFGGGKKQVEWLEKIHTLLDERLQKPEIVREGSWQDLMSQNEENDPENATQSRALADPSKSSGFDLMSLFGGLMDKLNPFSGDGGVGVDVDLPIGGDDTDRRDRRRTRRRGRRGMFGKLWDGAKRLGRGALNVGKAALPLAGSALALGGKALGAVAAGLGSVISAPVLLTGAAVAAVGTGAYLLYKNFANDPDGPLHSFRLMQYGIDPDAGDPVARISALEDKLEGEVSLGGGQPTLNQGIDPKELLEICGIDEDDASAIQSWSQWFQTRFKPVFLSHVAVLNSLASNVSLADVDDDLDDSLKSTYLKRVHFKEGSDAPYRATQAIPFDDIESMIGPAAIAAEYDKLMETLSKDAPKSQDETAIPEPKPNTQTNAITDGIDRRKKDSPTLKDMGGLSKAAYEKLSQTPEGRRLLERRRKVQAQAAQSGLSTVSLADEAKMSDEEIIARYEAENPDAGFDPMDTYRRQKARKEAHDRRGLDSSRIQVPDIGHAESTDVPKPTRDRPWMVTASGEDTSDDKKVEERRQRERRVSMQTETQTSKNAAILNTAVNRMVSILSDSHSVQSNIDKNLSEMNKMLKMKYEQELKDKEHEELLNKDDGGWFGSWFGGDDKKGSDVVPFPTNK